jgi:hypothetical protein
MSASGSKPEVVLLERHVRSTPETRHRQATPTCPVRANPLMRKSLPERTPDREGIMRKRVHMSVQPEIVHFRTQPKFNGDPLLIKRERCLITDAPYRYFSSCHFGEG